MNGAQLHLSLNHVPVVLSITGLAILAWGWVRKNWETKRVGLCLMVASAIFAGAAFFTGEPAEDILRNLPSFSKELIHEHEEAGEAALVISIAAGAAALATLYSSKKKPQFLSRAFAATLVLALLSSLAFFRTAHLGGLIRHEEIRPQPAN